MNIINGAGNYAYQEGTKTLARSNHPVFKARIEVALGVNSWLYAPGAGHGLGRFATEKETNARINEFQKELGFYLKAYEPAVTDLFIERRGISLNLRISEDALDV